MDNRIKRVLAELKVRLTQQYGARLQGVYLFGSYARNEADEESDVDILVVLDRVESYSEEINRSSEAISEISLKYGLTISRVFSTDKQWREDPTLFFLNVREEAIPV